MGYCARTLLVVIILVALSCTLLHTLGAAEDLEVFAGQDRTSRVRVPVLFNDVRLVSPDPPDPTKEYNFSWDFDIQKDSNLDGVFDNDAESNEMYTEWTYWYPGTFTVTLTVDDGELEDKDTLLVMVLPNTPPEIVANETEIVRIGEEHTFYADAIDDVDQPHLLRWYWDFDDGSKSNDPPPVTHTFNVEGVYQVQIRVTDTDNMYTEHTLVLHVVENLISSTVNVLEGETLKGEFMITGAITSDVTLELVEVQFDLGEWHAAEGVLDWSYLMDTTQLDQREHTLSVRAWEGETPHDLLSISFKVDNPPFIDIVHPVRDLILNGTLVASGTAWDDGWLDSVEARVDTDQWSAVNGTREWTFIIDTFYLDHGNHTLSLRGRDKGQYSEVFTVQFYVDQVPTVLIHETRVWTVTEAGLISKGTFWNDGTESLVEIRVDGGVWSRAIYGPQFPPPDSWQFEFNTTGLASGGHVLEARAYDGYQFSPIVSTMFHVNRPPEVELDPEPEDIVITTQYTLSGEDWSVTIDVKDLDTGVHTVEVRAFDGEVYSDIVTTTFNKKEEEGPGFSAVIVGLALVGSTIIALFSRR